MSLIEDAKNKNPDAFEQLIQPQLQRMYYVNVSDIIRDENTGYVKEIIGEKVDRQTYEKSEASLWSGEQITTLWLFDYDGEVDLGNATTDEVAQVAWMNREQIKELFDANMFVDTLEYFFTEVDK